MPAAEAGVGPDGGIGGTQGGKPGKGLFHLVRLIVEKAAIEAAIMIPAMLHHHS